MKNSTCILTKAFIAPDSEMMETDGPVDRDGQNGNGSMAHKKDSAEAPSPSPGGEPLTISFTTDELRYLESEIERLTQHEIICRVVGSRTSRSDLKDMLYGKLMLEASTITDIQLLGKGLYLIEFEKMETARNLLTMNPLELRNARAFFSPWKHGFNATEVAEQGQPMFKVMAILPNLPKEYVSLLHIIGGKIGIPFETQDSMATRIYRANGMPSVKILVAGIEALPNIIQLPTLGGHS